MKHYGPEEIPVWGWGIIAAILITQSTLLFIQAKKRGRAPWLWGLVGLIQFPVPTIVFIILCQTIWKDRSA